MYGFALLPASLPSALGSLSELTLCRHFAARSLLRSPGLFPRLKAVCSHAQQPPRWLLPLGRAVEVAAHSLSQRLGSSSALSWPECPPWAAGTLLLVFGNAFPSGGGMGGVGMP